MTDSYVQVPPDSTGKKLEVALVQHPDGVDTYRQKMADHQKIEIEGEIAERILTELKVLSFLMARIQGALLADVHPIDLQDLRQELTTINIRS